MTGSFCQFIVSRQIAGNERWEVVGGQVKAEATKRAAMATRLENDNGNSNGDKSNWDSNKGGRRATTRAMVVVTTVAGNDEGNCNHNEGGKQQRG